MPKKANDARYFLPIQFYVRSVFTTGISNEVLPFVMNGCDSQLWQECGISMVGTAGLEPAQLKNREILSLLRLPISPCPHSSHQILSLLRLPIPPCPLRIFHALDCKR